MQLPRHNVPQYLGNAPWDGVARDSFGRLVSAMMGDPFAFVVTPELDALRRVLMSPEITPAQLVAQMRRAWTLDVRFEGAATSIFTRNFFMNAVSGLSAEFILNSSSWSALGPPVIKRRIEQALTGQVSLSPEAAMCAAVHMVDTMFAQRGQYSVMNDLIASATELLPNASASARQTLFEELYENTPATNAADVRDDPHNVIYTLPYQFAANGYYGGNMSVKFTATDYGSGIDMNWAMYRGCPVPGMEQHFCGLRERWLDLSNSSNTPACDQQSRECNRSATQSLISPDQGEMRTPNYKAPTEVLGLSLFEWNTQQNLPPRCSPPQRDPQAEEDDDCPPEHPPEEAPTRDYYPRYVPVLKFDVTSLVRKTEWVLHRKAKSNRRNDTDPFAESIFIAYPEALVDNVYGVDYHDAEHTFTAAPPPPLSWGAEAFIEEENYLAMDVPALTERNVPIWGIIYPCAHTNLPDDYKNTTVPDGPIEPIRCEAMHRLKHQWYQFSFMPVYPMLYNATLPTEWEQELAELRPWTSDATIDLAADDAATGATEPAGERRELCVMAFAVAVRLDATGRCD